MRRRRAARGGTALAMILALSAGLGPAAADDGAPPPGIEVTRHRLPEAPSVDAGDRMLTAVRVDPRRYGFTLLTEATDGSRRPVDEWVRDFGLTGAINAGMFLPDGRSVGFLMVRDAIRSHRSPARFDGLLAFDPRRAATAPFVLGGARCPGRDLAWARTRYRSVLQVRTLLLDCAGRPVPWPNRRRYSAAAIGVDRDGWVVLLHVRTPYRMGRLARMLADLDLDLRGVAYLEGGPEASLIVRAPGARLRRVGSFEDGFNENDGNRELWPLPNVIGFSPHRGDGE